jgi:uncharacterized Zn finger protein
VNKEAWERIEEFRVGERVESDHLVIAFEEAKEREKQRRKGVGDRNKTVFFNAILCLKKM